ncbi:MAG TPA: ribokinase [Rhodospirillaceae bacterium]|nr:ribokinase [Alphaproteobacteria bacterium]OUT40873.1 MAG: ribokinase [Micavibrio sp. TMED2]HCI46538.1 ribokinase [Rhodospirillaceae bacterium]MAS47647.1 ribokinase [Alphaproteobacteria bacterium]MAX96481.1 ribokinase [Alphaproteobacteria bacterium]|tara:strand:+ start:4293 stop:4877 length:585 start_codon:yes stop_codon:yes gene_type:complete
MIPAILAQLGIPLLIKLVGEGLRKLDNPIADGAADALSQVDDAITAGKITPERVAEANRHTERMAQIAADEYRTTIAEVNASLRTEVASGDAYVRRMRPTFGYVMALTWAGQMGAIAYVIVTDPGKAGAVIAAMASLGTIWTVGLSVLGIYVYKRSQEKQTLVSDSTGFATGTDLLNRLFRADSAPIPGRKPGS